MIVIKIAMWPSPIPHLTLLFSISVVASTLLVVTAHIIACMCARQWSYLCDSTSKPLINVLSVFNAHDDGKLPISALITWAHKQDIKSWKQSTDSSILAWNECDLQLQRKKNIVQQQHGGNKGFCQNPLLSHQCVCEILSVLLCACQATLASIWITLMRGERGNNQRSQYFTLDTDAYLYAAGRRDLLAAQLSSDLTLRFNATFLSPTHSSRFLSHSLSALALPPRPPASVHSARLPDCS